jgi:phosphomannomutase/phosphoglucomutase
VRARFADGWGLVRASNTQPALVVRCEAKDQSALREIRATIDQHITEARRAAAAR